MSYIISGLNINNIFEYDSSQSYEKYDIIDFQLNSGPAYYPSAGGSSEDLYFWFNNENLSSFRLDPSNQITGWINKVSDSKADFYAKNSDVEIGDFKNLVQLDSSYRPNIDFNEEYTFIKGGQFLTGKGFSSENRTLFLCFEALPYSNNTYEEQTLLVFDETNVISQTAGTLKIKGDDSGPSTAAYISFDGVDYTAKCQLYREPNIITLIQTYDSNTQAKTMRIRQNGQDIASLNNFNDGWLGEVIKIADNPGNLGIKYYDFFAFSVELTDEQVGYYEKYLFENYFNNEGLYFAKLNTIPAGESYSPMTRIGKYTAWTRNIDDLFNLSYGSSANFSSKLSVLDFGDGYRSVISNSINSLNSSFSLKYEGLTDKQAKSLITFFENAPENKNKSIYEGFSGINTNLFFPYKNNAELYFKNISFSSPYNNINEVTIQAESLYDSNLDYRGMFVQLGDPGKNIRIYENDLEGFSYNDIVYVENERSVLRGYYFYTGQNTDGVISENNRPLGSDSHFTKDFYFKEGIDYSVDSELRLNAVEFENSTLQYLKDGINYNNIELNLSFQNRSNSEAKAILKFLDDKAGFKIFEYLLPQPYNKTIKVYCPEWSHTYNFYDNHSIQAKFIKINSSYDFQTIFNTTVSFVP